MGNTARLLTWALSRALYLTARALSDRAALPMDRRVELHLAAWSLDEPQESTVWGDLHTLALASLCDRDEAGVCLGHAWATVYTPVRLGRLVVAAEWSPDGGGALYVLDARRGP